MTLNRLGGGAGTHCKLMALSCVGFLIACRPGRDQAEAARPDPELWVSTNGRVYHCQGVLPDQPGTGAPSDSELPWAMRLCDAGTSPVVVDFPEAAKGLAPLPMNPRPRVRVNTETGVYSCEGSRSYEAAKTGKLMSEQAAIAAGHVSAEGRRCP